MASFKSCWQDQLRSKETDQLCFSKVTHDLCNMGSKFLDLELSQYNIFTTMRQNSLSKPSGETNMCFVLLDITSWFLASSTLLRNHSRNLPGFPLQRLIPESHFPLTILVLGNTWRLAFSVLHLPCYQIHTFITWQLKFIHTKPLNT